MSIKPRTATPLTPGEMAQVLEEAYGDVFHAIPTATEMSWLLALARHENANGDAIIQHNWGNRAALASDDYWVPRWADMAIADVQLSPRELSIRKAMLDGKPVPKSFAAYPNHHTGARKYLSLFTSETHQRIRDAAKDGNATAFHRGVYEPHPKTGMVYCVECGTPETGRQYISLAADSRKFFAHLPDPKVQAAATSSGSSELSRPPQSTLLERSAVPVELPVLRLGMRGNAVELLRLLLGVSSLGIFDIELLTDVRGFQARHSLKVDGLVGPKTWDRLFNKLRSE